MSSRNNKLSKNKLKNKGKDKDKEVINQDKGIKYGSNDKGKEGKGKGNDKEGNDSNNTNLYLLIGIIVILLLVLIYKINKNKNNEHFASRIDFNNSDILDADITNEDKEDSISYELLNQPFQTDNKQKIHYLYLTGGFDSTFRLCEMLINEKKIVQPIYVSLVLDNDCESEETCNKLWLRRNRNEERMAMKKIYKKLNDKFPYTKKSLLPIVEVDENIDDELFNMEYEKKFYKDNLWPKKRKKHQYLFLTKYAYYHKKSIDIGVLGIHEGTKFANYLKKTLINHNNNYIIPHDDHILTYLNFPLYGKTKKKLLEISKKYNYDDVLKLTWSCWFPNSGKPCGKCPMCKERIVEHPDLTSIG
jgi:7-cyano-7-deazaguanine synthase in queuosine biosynthesis